MNRISIPKPCHENWNDMLPEAQGKHCLACSKTVIDFSTWQQEDILNYLQHKNGEKICGRFNASQIEQPLQPENVLPVILKSNMSLLKKIAAIVLLCFGVISGTESYGQGEINPRTVHNTAGISSILGDTIIEKKDTIKRATFKVIHPNDSLKQEPQIMGMIAPPAKIIKPDTVQKQPSKNKNR